MPYPMVQPSQPHPAPTNALFAGFRDQIATPNASTRTARRNNGQGLRAEPSHGLSMQHAMQHEQHALDPRSSRPTTPTEGGPVCHPGESNFVSQTPSPATVQGDGVARQLTPDCSVYSTRAFQPVQPNGTHFQPRIPAFTPYQPILNHDNGQESHNVSMSTLAQPPGQMFSYGVGPVHLATVNQQRQFEQTGYHFADPGNAFPMHNPAAAPSADFDALTISQDCTCGPNCNCIYCAAHPFNSATQERVHDLTELLANDNYRDGNPHVNGTDVESEIEQGYPPAPDDESFDSNPLGWINVPNRAAALQPTFGQGESINNNDQPNHLPSATLRNSRYFTIGYSFNSNCTDATGACLCGSECQCAGCLTHQGHNGYPN